MDRSITPRASPWAASPLDAHGRFVREQYWHQVTETLAHDQIVGSNAEYTATLEKRATLLSNDILRRTIFVSGVHDLNHPKNRRDLKDYFTTHYGAVDGFWVIQPNKPKRKNENSSNNNSNSSSYNKNSTHRTNGKSESRSSSCTADTLRQAPNSTTPQVATSARIRFKSARHAEMVLYGPELSQQALPASANNTRQPLPNTERRSFTQTRGSSHDYDQTRRPALSGSNRAQPMYSPQDVRSTIYSPGSSTNEIATSIRGSSNNNSFNRQSEQRSNKRGGGKQNRMNQRNGSNNNSNNRIAISHNNQRMRVFDSSDSNNNFGPYNKTTKVFLHCPDLATRKDGTISVTHANKWEGMMEDSKNNHQNHCGEKHSSKSDFGHYPADAIDFEATSLAIGHWYPTYDDMFLKSVRHHRTRRHSSGTSITSDTSASSDDSQNDVDDDNSEDRESSHDNGIAEQYPAPNVEQWLEEERLDDTCKLRIDFRKRIITMEVKRTYDPQGDFEFRNVVDRATFEFKTMFHSISVGQEAYDPLDKSKPTATSTSEPYLLVFSLRHPPIFTSDKPLHGGGYANIDSERTRELGFGSISASSFGKCSGIKLWVQQAEADKCLFTPPRLKRLRNYQLVRIENEKEVQLRTIQLRSTCLQSCSKQQSSVYSALEALQDKHVGKLLRFA
jgi:hypothetical protein